MYFIEQHKEKIEEDISKMIEYGELIYTGKNLNDNGKTNVNVFIKDTWVIIADVESGNIITLYSIDLGAGKDFNLEYISKMKEQLNEAKEAYEKEADKIKESVSEYQEIIKNNEASITEYNKLIRSLNEQNETFKELIASTQTNHLGRRKYK